MKETIDTYNAIALEYYKRSKSYGDHSKLKTQLNSFLKGLDGNRILDAGAGSCRDSIFFKSKGFRVEAVDMAGTLLQASASEHPNIHRTVMDIRNLAFKDRVFNGVWCSAVFLHFDIEAFKNTLIEFYRVIKPGGILHFSVKEGQGTKRIPDKLYNTRYRHFFYYLKTDILKIINPLNWKIQDIDIHIDPDSNDLSTKWISCLVKRK